MSLPKTLLLASTMAASALAQGSFPFPIETNKILCDGKIQPDYEQCEALINEVPGEIYLGPAINDGHTFSNDGCQLRFAKCGGDQELEFPVSSLGGFFSLVKNQCGPGEDLFDQARGGAFRQGDACIVVETAQNAFTPSGGSRKARRHTPSVGSHYSTDVRAKQARRNLISKGERLEERQCDEGECYTYKELVFETNVRGFPEHPCMDIQPGGSCTKSFSVAVGETTSGSFTVGTGIEGIVDLSASFERSTSETKTETISVDIPIECESGRGAVVWYPLMEISRGECGKGPGGQCNGGCITEEVGECSFARPIEQAEGRLSGEFDVECL